jgi:superfamily II DNA/RNA helicase
MVNILQLRNEVIAQYKSYVGSFLNITDKGLRTYAESILDDNKLWPDPLLQCNPGFKKGETVEELVAANVLHREMAEIFTGFELHQHQAEAIKIGAGKKDFIVTSGTGSGKSLTYLGTIFNGVLQLPEAERDGIKAIVVYPMNALINSQEIEIKKYESRYNEGKTADSFPITFGKYTGQETAAQKKEVIQNPPNILLTNYMMLELLLTRSKKDEKQLRDSIFKGLQYLVFDELHTYRGRQGADVALLIRRIKASAQNTLVCMGTSATLSSGDLAQQKSDVAHLGKQLFDSDFTPEQIIGEKLEVQIKGSPPVRNKLAESLKQPFEKKEGFNHLEHPLSCWMERKVALAYVGEDWVRGKPKTIQQIAEMLHEASGVELPVCLQRLDEFLRLLQQINIEEGAEFMPFRIHQFIAQTGAIKVTLEAPDTREITQSKEPAIYKLSQRMPLYTVLFNRQSGMPYIRVKRTDNRLLPWSGSLEVDEIDRDNTDEDKGYLIIQEKDAEPFWDATLIDELLPATWMDKRKDGPKLKKNKVDFLPQEIYFDAAGNFSNTPEPNLLKGWFMAAPLHLDPVSGIIYEGQTREFNKFAQIGDIGRSISTTILSYNVLKQLQNQKAEQKIQKVLSFTDNRQDAALQSGHFNDFMQQAFLRSAVYHALAQHQKKNTEPLEQHNVVRAVFEVMKLKQDEYANAPSERRQSIKQNEDAFKLWLKYQLLTDLRRGWRHRLPNLEQCGLLEIRYKALEGACATAKEWTESKLLSQIDANERYKFVVQFLNYFRSAFALHHHDLERGSLADNTEVLRGKLKETWLYRREEDLIEPFWMRVQALKSKLIYTQSIGPSSAVGRYLKMIAKKNAIGLEKGEAEQELTNILECLDKLGYIHKSMEVKGVPLYRLKVDQLQWVLGDGKTIVLDDVRNRSMKDREVEPNAYFQELYKRKTADLKKMISKEHTGQIPAETRQITENEFRAAKIRALFCSPTMELGIDIDELAVVHMRNVPPNPANYAQRSGRAGRKGQGALILTFCSEYSSHDRHFFENRIEMVSGTVQPQKLDLTNPELLETHLNAAFLAECDLWELKSSLADIVDIEKRELPLLPAIKARLQLSDVKLEKLATFFKNVIRGIEDQLIEKPWYTSTWVEDKLSEAPIAFDRSCDRWRKLHDEAFESREVADSKMKLPHLAKKDKDWREAHREFNRDQRKLDLLKNRGGFKDFSEFYPYRYFAAEGFLPGYDFTRLPIRVFLDAWNSDGIYISRPRDLAITEFGPENIIYQGGSKWKIKQMLLPPAQEKISLETATIDKQTGFFSLGDEAQTDVNAFTAVAHEHQRFEKIPNLLQLQEMTAQTQERISCQEDERVKKGFKLETFFSYQKELNQSTKLMVEHAGDELLNIHFLPAADIVRVNRKWNKSKEEGFLIHTQTGTWKTKKQKEEATEEENALIKSVLLHTHITADCLYLEPLRNLSLDHDAVVTLMYSLKAAIEQCFQAEPQEIRCLLMGTEEHPNILFYEASEGSLGVLSQLVKSSTSFMQILEKAYAICHFEKGDDIHPKEDEYIASYSDLLSYYNQRHHAKINRFLIKGSLELLLKSKYKVIVPTQKLSSSSI